MRVLVRQFALAAVLLEAGCSSGQRVDTATLSSAPAATAVTRDAGDGADAPAVDDPAESMNRRIFSMNLSIDHHVAKPVATEYEVHVPTEIRDGVHNFSTNLGEPKVLVNDVLQGNLARALNTTGRFVLNSTVGVAGVFDVADKIGMPHHVADFGQTFGVWGISPGPAVQLPLLGSSSVRDSVGAALGFVADPLSHIPGTEMTVISVAGGGGGMVDGRAEILDASNDIEKNSLDYYGTLRSINAQRRAELVDDGRAGLVHPAP